MRKLLLGRLNGNFEQADGLDFSHWQEGIAGADLSEYEFIFQKATQGDNLVDHMLAEHWAWIEQYPKLVKGVYLYFVSYDDPVAQSQHLKNTLEELGIVPDMIALDVEQGGGTNDFEGMVYACITDIRTWFDGPVILYTNKNYYENYLHSASWLNEFPLWLAWPTDWPLTGPSLPKGAEGWTFWQKSWKHRVPGFGHNVDYNLFNGTTNDLWEFVSKDPPPPPDDLAAQVAKNTIDITALKSKHEQLWDVGERHHMRLDILEDGLKHHTHDDIIDPPPVEGPDGWIVTVTRVRNGEVKTQERLRPTPDINNELPAFVYTGDIVDVWDDKDKLHSEFWYVTVMEGKYKGTSGWLAKANAKLDNA